MCFLQDQAFQNSLFDNLLIRQPMMQQHDAPQRPPPPMNQHQQEYVIYVGNLAPEATNDLLLERFKCNYHSPTVAKICFDGRSGATYGFVSFADEREKWDAMKVMNRKFFLDRQMHIGPAAKNSI